jgi:aminopeptidase N
VDGYETSVPQAEGIESPDLLLLNDDDLAYAKIRLDESSWANAVKHLGAFEDSLPRTLVWGAAWDATRDAETSPREFIKLVLGNIAAETESTTILTLLRQLITTGNLYVAAKHREEYLVAIGDGLLDLARKATPGSDLQLQLLKFFPQFARTASQLDALESILAGTEKINGLEIDADLRWELLTGLVVAGRKGETEINSALAADNTANGQRAAAGARAAIPTAAAKAKAWSELVDGSEMSNALVQSASLGFVRVIEPALLSPYVDQYFEQGLHIWKKNTFKIAEYLLVNLYPLALAGEDLVRKTKEWIAKPQVKEIPALRRILVENLAAVERALAAQARDSKDN